MDHRMNPSSITTFTQARGGVWCVWMISLLINGTEGTGIKRYSTYCV